MADPRVFELEDLVVRPGTYFNPQTEVLIIVDDSPEMDQEIFNMEKYEGADWVLVADEVPVDEHARDEAIERFQVRYHPGTERSLNASEDVEDDAEVEELVADDQEVGRDD
jgi:hypothetical protein